MKELSANSYGPGHPRHYVLGGRPPMPSEIRQAAIDSGYQGYRTDIRDADAKAEPQRSIRLRQIEEDVVEEFWRNLDNYCKRVREYRAHRKSTEPQGEFQGCLDVHVNLSLKHSHLYNDFAHLILIEELMSKQRDLFDDRTAG